MKIVFKVIAIIGLLSFFGALKNGVFFFIGLVLASVFGYFGWRPKKKNSDRNIINSNIQVQPTNFRRNSENTEEKLKNIYQKIELLNSSFSKGLLIQNEFRKKLTKLEIEKEQLLKIVNAKDILQAIMIENKTVFDELLELKENGLISNEEYLMKKSKLIDSFKIEKGIEIVNGPDPTSTGDILFLFLILIIVAIGIIFFNAYYE